jgi:UMF1 family MFS transporter
VADRPGVRRPLFIGFTALSVTATALMATVEPGMVAWGFLLGVLGNVGFEGALVYYNAWLPQLAPPSMQGRLSGWGFAVGYAGSIVALLIALPFVRAEAFDRVFLATAALFGGFALPAFLFLPRAPGAAVPPLCALRDGFAEVGTGIRTILGHQNLSRFFGAYFFYEDGVNTVIAFAAIFAGKTLGFTFVETITLFLVVQLTALVGSAAWARTTDTRGPKFVVRCTLVQWTVVTVLAFFVQEKSHFWVVAVLAGTGLGAIQAASRAFMATLVPSGREAEFFGFYALVGKTGAVFGPLLFGTVSFMLAGNQRAAIVAVGLFFVIGFVLLRRVPAGGPTHGGPAAAYGGAVTRAG